MTVTANPAQSNDPEVIAKVFSDANIPLDTSGAKIVSAKLSGKPDLIPSNNEPIAKSGDIDESGVGNQSATEDANVDREDRSLLPEMEALANLLKAIDDSYDTIESDVAKIKNALVNEAGGVVADTLGRNIDSYAEDGIPFDDLEALYDNWETKNVPALKKLVTDSSQVAANTIGEIHTTTKVVKKLLISESSEQSS